MSDTYDTIDLPYDNLLNRTPLDGDNGNVNNQPVKSGGNMGDITVDTYIKSTNYAPKTTGFYIDGLSGHAEFCDVYVAGNIQALTGTIGGFTIGSTNLSVVSGGNTVTLSAGAIAFSAGPTGSPTVIITQAGALTATAGTIGGFTLGTDYIRDNADSFGMASTITGGNDVRLWAGSTFVNRATAPFRVYEDGSIAGTGIVVTHVDIPDTTTANSFHVDSSGNSWWGTNIATGYATAPAYILNTGAAKFTSITITGGIIDGTSTLGGRLASTLATAIDSGGAFINANLNTSAKTILGSFTFSGSGAIAMNTDASNGLWLSPTGILGKKAGNYTFTIDTGGNVTMVGTVTAASGTIGGWTIGSTTLTGGGVTLNSSTGNINGATITGSTLQTAASGQRVYINASNIQFYDSGGNNAGELIGYNKGIAIQTAGSLGILQMTEVGSNSLILIENQSTSVTLETVGVYIYDVNGDGLYIDSTNTSSTGNVNFDGGFLGLPLLTSTQAAAQNYSATASAHTRTSLHGYMYYRTDDNTIRVNINGTWRTLSWT